MGGGGKKEERSSMEIGEKSGKGIKAENIGENKKLECLLQNFKI